MEKGSTLRKRAFIFILCLFLSRGRREEEEGNRIRSGQKARCMHRSAQRWMKGRKFPTERRREKKRVSLFDVLASECCQHLVCISSVFVIRFVEKSNLNVIITMIAWQMESKLGLFLSLSPLLSVGSIEHHLNAKEWRRIRSSFLVSNVFALVLLTVQTKKRIYRNLTIRKSCAEKHPIRSFSMSRKPEQNR